MDIKKGVTKKIVKKVFRAGDRRGYLLKLKEYKNFELKTRRLTCGKNKGKLVLDMSTHEVWQKIVDTWEYKYSLKIVRELFKKSEKYKNGKAARYKYPKLEKEWQSLGLGEIGWPCGQGAFDNLVQGINNTPGITNKDKTVARDAVKYRRMKELNTIRNDFLEVEIFEKNNNILPTLKHRRGTDYFIDGKSFDQKVAKSPTTEFKNDFDDWKNVAISKPELVAKYLYKHQDEGRFGADSRLLIVYLDDDVDVEEVETIIDNTDLTNPLKVTFTYNHKIQGRKKYTVNCFVILLYSS